ncbi:MAG: decaprenyl-phosphate phosphoribosyltransferase [Micrococcales bacterium]|nr:decaprenyl-phosphate phosphoribosyltransferase [Micrococcales bacterium]
MISGLLKLMRPKQWLKNSLVAAAPLAAGRLHEPEVALKTLLTFVIFCMAASSCYALNDTLDAEEDARHPTKRFRPVASGLVPKPAALTLSVVLAALAIGLASGPLRWVVGAYILMTIAYSSWLKHVPVLELGLLSAGFLLRAVAGGPGADIEISQWFLIVTAFGSMFMGVGKRLGELTRTLAEGTTPRKSVAAYPLSYLQMMATLCMGVTVTAYCLWAFQVARDNQGSVWAQLSIVPFVLALMSYALDVDKGNAEEPENVVLGDRTLQALGLVWLVLFAMGVML